MDNDQAQKQSQEDKKVLDGSQLNTEEREKNSEQSEQDFIREFAEFMISDDDENSETKTDKTNQGGEGEGGDKKDDKEKDKEDKSQNLNPDPNELKIKWNGQEIPLSEAVKTISELAGSDPEVIAEVQKRFDYTKKSKELAEQRALLETSQKDIEFVKLENLALQIGQVPTKPFYDPLCETNGEVMKNEETGEVFQVFNTVTDFQQAEKHYGSWVEKYKQVIQLSEATAKANKEIEDEFRKNYPDVDITELSREANKYLLPSLAKGLAPFPKDILEVFYRGKNFDKLVEARETKAREEQRQKDIEEFEKAGKLSADSKLGMGAPDPKPTITDDEDDDDDLGNALTKIGIKFK